MDHRIWSFPFARFGSPVFCGPTCKFGDSNPDSAQGRTRLAKARMRGQFGELFGCPDPFPSLDEKGPTLRLNPPEKAHAGESQGDRWKRHIVGTDRRRFSLGSVLPCLLAEADQQMDGHLREEEAGSLE